MDSTRYQQRSAPAAASHAQHPPGDRASTRRNLAESRERFRSLESDLLVKLQRVERDLAAAHAQLLGDRAALDQQAAALADERRHVEDDAQLLQAATDKLEAQRRELDDFDKELDGQLHEVKTQAALLSQRGSELDRRHAELDQVEQRLQQQYAEHSLLVQRTEAERLELNKQRHELEKQQARLTQRHTDTQVQRRRIARELRTQRAEMLVEIERRRAELDRLNATDQNGLQTQLVAATTERDHLREQLAAREHEFQQLNEQRQEWRRQSDMRQAETQLLRMASDKAIAETQLKAVEAERACRESEHQMLAAKEALTHAREEQDQLRQLLAETRQRLEQCGSELEQVRTLASSSAATASAASHVELEELRVECELLREQLAAGKGATTTDAAATDELDRLRRRFEGAVQEVRELKTLNQELEGEVARLKRTGGSAPASSGASAPSGGLDWESQKKRMLEQLEADFDESDANQKQQKLTIEGTIKITDEIVAQKERELVELERLLKEQSNNIGGMAVGASAVAAMLDQDDLVRNERENLKRMQDELQEKLRKAEIELSVERAKIARERTELMQKLSLHEREQAQSGQDKSATPADPKASRGRWLSRLGLKDDAPGGK